MSTQQLFIPDKIKTGFQNRQDTYTGKLAYVIYYDQKGVLRKEKSWQGWRDKAIEPIECDNVPTEGFVLNKGVGGQRHSYGWNARNEYIRVYDPRNFEFEISVANLLFILRECDCSRGKGLEGKFVYAWDGTELVLLPEASQDYQNSKKFTDLQSEGVKAKDLIPGASYTTKKQQVYIYLGRFDYHFLVDRNKPSKTYDKGVVKRHVFCSGDKFVYLDDMKSLAQLNSETVVGDYAELVDKYNKSLRGSRVVDLFLKEASREELGIDQYSYYNDTRFYEEDRIEGESLIPSFVEYTIDYEDYAKTQVNGISSRSRYFIDNGLFVVETYSGRAYKSGIIPHYHYRTEPYKINWRNPTDHRLYATLESGETVRVTRTFLYGY